MNRTFVTMALAVAMAITALPGSSAWAQEATCDGRPADIVGTPGDDVITVPPRGEEGSVVAALGGDDVIRGWGIICGDEGNDEIIATGLGALLFGGAGDDLIRGGDPRTVETTSAIGNYLIGGPGNDVLDGRPLNGATTFHAQLDYETAPGPVVVDLGEGRATGDGVDTIIRASVVRGSNFDDTITGDGFGNLIIGEGGSDTMIGLGGDDTLASEIGWRGVSGGDVFDGGPGDDRLMGAPGADRMTGGEGDDFLYGREGEANALDGGPGTDTASFRDPGIGVTVDLVAGTTTRDGEDTSTITGVENVEGGRFADSITGDDSPNVIRAGDGNDVVAGGGGRDSVFGRSGHDVIRGEDGDDTLVGGRGDDNIDGGNGDDSAAGLSGYDTCLRSETRTGCESTGDGPLPPLCLGRMSTIIGSEGADRLEGTGERDVIWAGGGADRIQGLGKSDVICGGSGDDVIDGGRGPDSIDSSEGADTIEGGEGSDQIHGGDDDDRIVGGTTRSGQSVEQLFGDDGNDVIDGSGADFSLLEGGAGNDRLQGGTSGIMDGGEGDDTLMGAAGSGAIATYALATQAVVVDLAAGTATGMGSDTLAGVGMVIGSDFDDSITGDEHPNRLHGGAGDDTLLDGDASDPVNCEGDDFRGDDGADTIDGGDGCDYVDAGPGDDVVRGGSGPDSLNGGTGADMVLGEAGIDLVYASAGADVLDGGGDPGDTVSFSEGESVEANLSTGMATDGSGETDTLSGFSWVVGSTGADVLTGNDGANLIFGGDGRDEIFGLEGDDDLDGQNGSDSVDGGPGSDGCSGESIVACEREVAQGR